VLYTTDETLHFALFLRLDISRWLFQKRLALTYKPRVYLDFWLKDKNKIMLFYKASTFLQLLGARLNLAYRSSKQGFRYKFKPDTLRCIPDYKFLLNLRHFMYFGSVYRKGDYKNLNLGFLFKDLSDYIKSNTIDFYQMHLSFRINFGRDSGVEVFKSIFRLQNHGI